MFLGQALVLILGRLMLPKAMLNFQSLLHQVMSPLLVLPRSPMVHWFSLTGQVQTITVTPYKHLAGQTQEVRNIETPMTKTLRSHPFIKSCRRQAQQAT